MKIESGDFVDLIELVAEVQDTALRTFKCEGCSTKEAIEFLRAAFELWKRERADLYRQLDVLYMREREGE